MPMVDRVTVELNLVMVKLLRERAALDSQIADLLERQAAEQNPNPSGQLAAEDSVAGSAEPSGPVGMGPVELCAECTTPACRNLGCAAAINRGEYPSQQR